MRHIRFPLTAGERQIRPKRVLAEQRGETAGTFDLDSELDLWFSGLGRVRFAFTGKTNVVEIAKLIAEFAL